MKKFFVSAFAAFAMVAMVSCGGTNPSIAAAEALIANPTAETLKGLTDSFKELDADQAMEYQKWYLEHVDEVTNASIKVAPEL